MSGDPYEEAAEHLSRAGEAAARRRARRAAWIKRAEAEGRWGELEQLRDLVRRLTEAYRNEGGSGSCDHALLREALQAVEAMPPPPWE